MGNVKIGLPIVNGDYWPLADESLTSKEVVTSVIGDDVGAPPNYLEIVVTTDSGKKVQVIIPYSSSHAIVKIDGETL